MNRLILKTGNLINNQAFKSLSQGSQPIKYSFAKYIENKMA